MALAYFLKAEKIAVSTFKDKKNWRKKRVNGAKKIATKVGETRKSLKFGAKRAFLKKMCIVIRYLCKI